MGYTLVKDFKLGMDRRRERVAGIPGSLWTLKNAHITRGGDIERNKKFVSTLTPLTDTTGLAAIGSTLYTFGAGTTPSGLPAGITYQRLQHPSSGSATITKILDWGVVDEALYVIAEYSDGAVYHFYNGSRVTAWDTIATSIASINNVASALQAKIDTDPDVTASVVNAVITITSATAGTAVTVTQDTDDGGGVGDQAIALVETVANVAAVSAVAATASFRITGGTASAGVNMVSAVTVDGVDVLGATVDWTTSNSATATAVAAQINTYASSPNYTAAAVGDKVTITHPTAGATPNGFVLAVTAAGNVTTANLENMAGGVSAVSAVAQVNTATLSGTFQAADRWKIGINGRVYTVQGQASGTGVSVLVYKRRVYSAVGTKLYYCALDAPTDWTTAGVSGAGFIDFANQVGGAEDLVTAVPYQTDVAIFSRNFVRIQTLAESTADNAFGKTIENTGTRAVKGVTSFGSTDVFYLDESGIRSLRPRDFNNSAYATDVGNAIDSFVIDYLATLTDAQIQAAISVIEPVDKRLWLAVGNYVFVFSYYPASKISAWSYYDFGASIDGMVVAGRSVYLRSGTVVYRYGGSAGTTYPGANEQTVTVELPFFDGDNPAARKTLEGFDAALTNTWTVEILLDPNDTSLNSDVGVIPQTTYPKGAHAANGESTHFAPKLTCAASGRATLSSLAVHFQGGTPD